MPASSPPLSSRLPTPWTDYDRGQADLGARSGQPLLPPLPEAWEMAVDDWVGWLQIGGMSP